MLGAVNLGLCMDGVVRYCYYAYVLSQRAAQMLEHFSPSRLRANLYRILDYVLESGQPVAIERKGRRLRIVVDQGGKLDMLKPHSEYLKVPPEEIVHLDWSQEWRP
jgi:hypothetical protein